MVRVVPAASRAAINSTAASGSEGTPRSRVNTLAFPPGSAPSAGNWSAEVAGSVVVRPARIDALSISPLTASLIVPSPLSTSSASQPSATARYITPVSKNK